MADTVINQSPVDPTNTSDNGIGFIIGFIVLLILGILFFFYLIPFIGQRFGGGTQINVPRSVDVNVKK